MESKAKKKIIYTDNNLDKAITGFIVSEDDFFYEIKNGFGRTYKIGKKAVVCIKDVGCGLR